MDPQKFSSESHQPSIPNRVGQVFWCWSEHSLVKKDSLHPLPRDRYSKGRLSLPTATTAEPVYHPVSEGWEISPRHSQRPVREPDDPRPPWGRGEAGSPRGLEGKEVPQLPRRAGELFSCSGCKRMVQNSTGAKANRLKPGIFILKRDPSHLK